MSEMEAEGVLIVPQHPAGLCYMGHVSGPLEVA